MKLNQDLSILFWLYRAKKSADGKIPIYVRITIDCRRAQFSLGRKIEAEQWNGDVGLMVGKSEEAKTINSYIAKTRGDIERHYNILLSNNEQVSAEMVLNSYMGIKEETRSILQAFEYHNQRFLEKAKTGIFSMKTHIRFEMTKRKVIDFMKTVYKVSDLPLAKIKYPFATDFEHFLTVKKGLQSNTAMKQIKNIKKVMNMAVNLEWITSNPLNGFKCTYVNPEREILTPLELNELYQKEITSKRLEAVRDIYVFCCYTGYAYAEVEKLSPDDVCIGIDGERWIRTMRQKTDGKENIMLLPIALDIIEKYKHHSLCKARNRLLPVISNEKFNIYLREVAGLCGIKKHITSHTARHTFATSVTLTNGVPIETVSEMLGHKDIRTTQVYAKIVQQKLSIDMKALREKLQSTHNGTTQATG